MGRQKCIRNFGGINFMEIGHVEDREEDGRIALGWILVVVRMGGG
jgi:hypothetical protein